MRGSIFLAVGVSLIMLSACSKTKQKAPRAAGPVPVEVALVERKTIPLTIASIGTIEPMARVQLKPRVSGEIVGVHFADGANVEAGQELFTIDPRPYTVALERARANLDVARADAANANDQLKRYTTLAGQGSASKEQYGEFALGAASKNSQLSARQADVDEAALSVEWTTIRAPITGRIGAALLRTGNLVQANTEVLAVINQVRPIYVAFTLPEDSLGLVRRWMAGGELKVSVSDPANARLLGEGKLSFIDNAVDRESGMVAVRATLENEDESFWPGQFVDVSLRLTEEVDVAVVPSTAIMEGRDGARAFVVNDGVVALRNVRVARTVGAESVVADGLAVGETVVTSGQLRLVPGAKVTVSKPEERGG